MQTSVLDSTTTLEPPAGALVDATSTPPLFCMFMLVLEELRGTDDVSTLQVTARDVKDVLCLDARNVVRFALAGDGRLIDNLGTSITSRKVELYNGRALISVKKKGRSVVSVSSEALPTAFLNI